MAYEKKADGPVVRKGKTKAEVFPNDGNKVIDKGPKAHGGNLNKSMKAVGRNLARAANQKRG